MKDVTWAEEVGSWYSLLIMVMICGYVSLMLYRLFFEINSNLYRFFGQIEEFLCQVYVAETHT